MSYRRQIAQEIVKTVNGLMAKHIFGWSVENPYGNNLQQRATPCYILLQKPW
jgi:hypothetical protein